jgi:hypothetical protein
VQLSYKTPRIFLLKIKVRFKIEGSLKLTDLFKTADIFTENVVGRGLFDYFENVGGWRCIERKRRSYPCNRPFRLIGL